jgi:hypothetical protein
MLRRSLSRPVVGLLSYPLIIKSAKTTFFILAAAIPFASLKTLTRNAVGSGMARS